MSSTTDTRKIIENFIDTHVRYFGDTTKMVLVDELMEALAQPKVITQDSPAAEKAIQYDKNFIDYCDRNFPCEKPCDSYGVCDNCFERLLVEAGYELCLKALAAQEPRDEEIAKAAREYCKSWPTEVYHSNDLTMFYVAGFKAALAKMKGKNEKV